MRVQNPMSRVFTRLVVPMNFQDPHITHTIITSLSVALIHPIRRVVKFPGLSVRQAIMLYHQRTTLPTKSLRVNNGRMRNITIVQTRSR